MIIVGAGMAGLLAGHAFRASKPTICEMQDRLPNNHDALLRFRTDKVARATGIEFKKVLVRKAVVADGTFVDRPNPFVCNNYSLKVTGEVLDRSIWNFGDAERYIAPRNFIAQLARPFTISYSVPFDAGDLRGTPAISTIPMPTLMDQVAWRHKPTFKWMPVWAITTDLTIPTVDVYQTIHFADLSDPVYRASLTGGHLTIELVADPGSKTNQGRILEQVLAFFGLLGVKHTEPDCKRQEFGKINPIPEEIRQDFIYTMTRKYSIYSLGRFATWRQILLDDVVNDCEVIRSLINAEGKLNNYRQALSSHGPRP
jgi:hypothetical protein